MIAIYGVLMRNLGLMVARGFAKNGRGARMYPPSFPNEHTINRKHHCTVLKPEFLRGETVFLGE
jgi:hypothetical protein